MRPLARHLTNDRSSRMLVWALVLVAGTCLCAVTAGQSWRNWARAMDDASRQAGNIAVLAERHVAEMSVVADVLIQSVAGEGAAAKSVSGGLAKTIDDLPSVMSIRVLDPATGALIRQAPANTGRLDAVDMQAIQAPEGAGLRVGAPVRDGKDRWTVGLSRRFEGDGKPIVVVAHIDLGRFSALVGGVDVGQGGSIALQTAGGIILVRKPYDVSQVGRDISRARLYDEIREQGSVGTFSSASATDGVERIFAYRVVPNAPFVITVGISRDEVVSAWMLQAMLDAGTTLALLGLLAAGGGVVSRVLSRREALERARRESEAFLRSVLESSGDALVVLDPRGKVLFANRVAAAALSVHPDEAVGRDLTMLLPEPAGRSELAESIAAARHGHPARLSLRCPSAGTWRTLEAVLSPVSPEGSSDRIVFAARDVTDRLLAEGELREAKLAAETATQAKSDFLGSMSHEIRTPLNGLLGVTGILLASVRDERERELLKVQETAGRQLLGVVSNVIDWTRIEEGRLDLKIEAVDPRRLCDDCIGIVSPTAADKGVSLVLNASPAVPSLVRGDGVRLGQVLLNFLSNAVRHSPPGTVSVHLDAPVPGRLRMRVRDDGAGIPRERQHLLFVKFSQVGSGLEARSGSGLGLAIAKRLAEAMGGHVGVESEPGRGSTFWVDVPAAAQAEATLESLSQPAPAPGGRLLVAEDTPVNRTVIRAMLEGAGYDVTIVTNGADAVAEAARSSYALVVMDVRMPVMDGLEAARRIRALPSPRGLVPIVALTANVDASEVTACLDAGMDAHLPKPLDRRQLLDEVARRVTAGPRPPRLTVVA